MTTQNIEKFRQIKSEAWPPCSIALTGILGSGKSTAATILHDLGIPVVDCDQLSRRVTERGSAGLRRLCKALGKGILTPDGEMDREYVLKLILNDSRARKRVESILHPLILQQLHHELTSLASDGIKTVVCEVPLLFEAGWHDLFYLNCLVSAPEDQCLLRIMKRNGVDRDTAATWMSLQMPLGQKEVLADYIIPNDGTLTDLESEVLKFYNWISSRQDCIS